jgi:putative Mn2+ efflux pump MntP
MLTFLALLPLALGLSTDAFAASLARGGRERKAQFGAALKSGAIFGTTEGLMCLLGWSAASVFADQIRAFDHWIALVLLLLIGGRMIQEGLDEDDEDHIPTKTWFGTIVTAIGTSVDSAAVGVALALSGVTVWLPL